MSSLCYTTRPSSVPGFPSNVYPHPTCPSNMPYFSIHCRSTMDDVRRKSGINGYDEYNIKGNCDVGEDDIYYNVYGG